LLTASLKRNNYCLYNLGVYIIIAIRIIMIIVILSKVAKHGLKYSPNTESNNLLNIFFGGFPRQTFSSIFRVNIHGQFNSYFFFLSFSIFDFFKVY
jgi:hypothetical protein